MLCAELTPAELIRLTETALHQPDGFQVFLLQCRDYSPVRIIV